MKIIKIGGNIVDDPEKLDLFLADFAQLQEDKILVHGGGKMATALCNALGIPTTMIDGRRVTDPRTLQVAAMVYAGLVNKTIVGKLQALGCNALGLSGADGRLMPSRKRAPEPVDYGLVGDPLPEKFGLTTVRMLIDNGFVPVVAPITLAEDGGLLNTNADTVAQAIALGLSASCEVELVYCFEKQGVLRDLDDPRSVIRQITPASFEALKARGIVDGGMLPKLENAFRAIAAGVRSVVICSAEHIRTPGYGGTTLLPDPEN